MFTLKDGWTERMWVKVTAVSRRRIVGTLANEPFGVPRLSWGDKIRFRREHVISIDYETLDYESAEVSSEASSEER